MVLYKEHTLPPLELPYVDPFVRAPLLAKLSYEVVPRLASCAGPRSPVVLARTVLAEPNAGLLRLALLSAEERQQS